MIAIDVMTSASNMQPGMLAGLVAEQNDRSTDVTQLRWAAEGVLEMFTDAGGGDGR